MKHKFKLAFGALALALLGYLYMPLPSPRVAQASAGDCVLLHLWTNGYHSDIAAPAALFPEDHALRRLYPDAREFLLGWGDAQFYYAERFSIWRALDAVTPPSASVMHVTYNAPYTAAYLGPTDDLAIAVSQEGAARFVAFIDRALELGPDGGVVRTRDGKVVGRSAFVRTHSSFHLFNVCNQWMARALRAAGLDINARSAWFADELMREARARAVTTCPSALIPGLAEGQVRGQ